MASLPPPSDPFQEAYQRESPAYGRTPSPELASFLEQCRPQGKAIDLGAGAGRDTLEMARRGLHVTAVDRSETGLQRIEQRAEEENLSKWIDTLAMDVRELQLAPATYGFIAATTVLDHIPLQAAKDLWEHMIQSLEDTGALYVEVHTTDDPGSPTGRGPQRTEPVSETAVHVINHFAPNQLLQWAVETEGLHVLRYEERTEWDYTHGPEHLHAKAVLLASRTPEILNWYGHPAAFPKRAAPQN